MMPSKFQGTTGNRGGKVPAIGPGGTLRDEGFSACGWGEYCKSGKGTFENERRI